ncbi:MAG: hypothetical protein GY715_18085 [Planctomycetes bacterium]|nr:hypothetical protein [Planctomycetota bacterium]
MTAPAAAQQDRVSATEKGSICFFSKIEIRWDSTGGLLQDTFISLTNDYPGDVRVQMYYINGDPPVDEPGVRFHEGWNYVDNGFTLTGDQPTYWSALSGQPAVGGVAPFTSLDPGFPPGRPDPESLTGERYLRGYLIVWAVDATNCQIRWNHLKGEGTIVDYANGRAWEYNSWNHATVATVLQGDLVGTCGTINLDDADYSQSFDQLLMNFQAVGSNAFSGPRQVISDTDLTLHPCGADLTQEGCGPITTKADFDVWNMNEVKFSETERCITCWDQTLLSNYDTPNNFLLLHLQTAHGKARIDGKASQRCDYDADFDDGTFPPADPCDPDQATESSHPDDIVSQASALLGVVARMLTFDGGADYAAAGTNLVGMGTESCAVLYDQTGPPPEQQEEVEALEILNDALNAAKVKRLGVIRNRTR